MRWGSGGGWVEKKTGGGRARRPPAGFWKAPFFRPGPCIVLRTSPRRGLPPGGHAEGPTVRSPRRPHFSRAPPAPARPAWQPASSFPAAPATRIEQGFQGLLEEVAALTVGAETSGKASAAAD